jgi:formylmethanofuran dehydrogenase subunit C
VGSPAITTFSDGGRVEIAAGAVSVSGSYAFIEPGRLRIELTSATGVATATTYSAHISGDRMTLTDSEGATNDYVKVHR